MGLQFALRFARDGANVVLADVQQDALATAQAEVQAAGAAATLAVVTDVSSPESVQALADAAVERFAHVHVVCLNAGVGGGGLIKDQQLVDWQWVIGVNLWGVIHGVHSFLPLLRAHGQPAHLMATASVAGLVAGPGLGPYNASKFGVVAILETLHHELAASDPQIGVSVLCPGTVRTNITTSQRNRPEDLKRVRSGAAKSPPRDDARRRNANIAAAVSAGLDPAAVAEQVAQAMLDRQFWVLTHPDLNSWIRHRNDELASCANPTLVTDFTEGQ